MTIQADMALMAAGSYWDVRKGEIDLVSGKDTDNDAPIPTGWRALTAYDVKDSGPNASTGFSARVYENIATGQIVISYGGTEFNTSSFGLAADFLSGNIPLALGNAGAQALEAAKLYQRVKADPNLSDSISFTGHSLGGGIASVMAVWFNRPAYVFAAAPFQASADSTQATLLADIFSLNRALPNVRFLLGSTADSALLSYNPTTDFAARELNVTAYAIKGELLEATLGMFTWIEGRTNPLFTNTAITLSTGDKHSIDLHVAALLSDKFHSEAGKLPTALERLMDKKLYGGDVLGNQQVIMTKMIRNEVGVRNDSGTQVLLQPNGMLTHFANDLQKLGTNVAGLTKSAQDAILAQGIEWYYWQGNDYAGQEFFVNNEAQPGLLQYTTAQGYTKANGDHLAGAENKAAIYVKLWLDPKAAAHGAYAVATTYEQWNVNTGTNAVTATARDADKNQIFVGNFAAETFTGGNKNDVMLADDGDDTLDGGKGDDKLYGGNGQDTYVFTSTDLAGWGTDTISDTDGIIKIDADTLSGGKSISPRLGRAWISDDKKYQFQFKPDALTPNGTPADSSGTLVIHRTGRLADKEAIVLNNWSQGKFGITLTTDAALPVSPAQVRVVNGDTVPLNTTTDPDTGEVRYTGSATVASPGNSDAITAYNTSSSIKRVEVYGLDGNDALIGDAAQNLIDGGAGDDLIAGGLGLNTLA